MEPVPAEGFCFECRPDMECFTDCCQKLELLLTPIDILRLARRLEVSTTELLEQYTTAIERPGKLPRVALHMREDDQRCPFVSDAGCEVYEDRPGACRTYPLGRATSPSMLKSSANEAYFVVREPHCKGFDEQRHWTVEQWTDDQGLAEYNELNDLWMDILARQAAVVQSQGREQKERMFNLASYDIDTFRRFVLEGGLLERLELPERLIERLRTDDIQLMRFACSFLRLSLFGEMSSGLLGR